jgi:hypothetical protein
MTEFHDRQTMERLHQHLARADHELRDAQHFLDPAAAEEAEMDLVRDVAAARLAVTSALERSARGGGVCLGVSTGHDGVECSEGDGDGGVLPR